MKRFLLLSFIMLSCNVGAFTQELTYVEKFWGPRFQINGENTSGRKLEELIRAVPEAHKMYKRYQEASGVQYLLQGVGVGLVISGAAGKDWVVSAVGAGLFVGSLPLLSVAKKKALQAVQIFNEGAVPEPEEVGFQLKLEFNDKGVGLVAYF